MMREKKKIKEKWEAEKEIMGKNFQPSHLISYLFPVEHQILSLVNVIINQDIWVSKNTWLKNFKKCMLPMDWSKTLDS